MAKNLPLSRFGVLVAQLESIVASATHKSPDPLLCFDLLSDLISAIDQESKDSILLCQRKCEDALYSLLVLGARKPVRHLASVAMARIIQKGDSISIYSRASSLQGFLSDGKRSEPQRMAGQETMYSWLLQRERRSRVCDVAPLGSLEREEYESLTESRDQAPLGSLERVDVATLAIMWVIWKEKYESF